MDRIQLTYHGSGRQALASLLEGGCVEANDHLSSNRHPLFTVMTIVGPTGRSSELPLFYSDARPIERGRWDWWQPSPECAAHDLLGQYLPTAEIDLIDNGNGDHRTIVELLREWGINCTVSEGIEEGDRHT
jgi:hypothetical protein